MMGLQLIIIMEKMKIRLMRNPSHGFTIDNAEAMPIPKKIAVIRIAISGGFMPKLQLGIVVKATATATPASIFAEPNTREKALIKRNIIRKLNVFLKKNLRKSNIFCFCSDNEYTPFLSYKNVLVIITKRYFFAMTLIY
ncbi:MAG: hypothetical protein RR139_07635 [Lachnospiraceae bacterium]